MKKNVILLVTAVLGLLLLLTACGASGPSTDLRVNMTDFMFDPNNFTVPAGQTITITATNNGAVEHDFVILKLGTDAGANFDDKDKGNVYWDVKVQPGGSVRETFVAPSEPGDYYVTCGIPGHLEAGMVAKMTVVNP